jgi:hypothetical protein
MPIYQRYDRVEDRIADLNPEDRISRRQWAQAMGCILSQLDHPTLVTIIGAGRDEFVRVVHPIMAGHQKRAVLTGRSVDASVFLKDLPTDSNSVRRRG